MPVSTRAIWLAIAITSLGLFVMDVGIRRVRIEPAAIVSSVVRAFGRAKTTETGEQVESLRVARAKAQQRIGGAGAATAERETADAERSTKFEAEPATDRGKGDAPAEAIALSGEKEAPAFEGLSRPEAAKPKPQDEEQGMSRLMRAKKRALDDYKDE